MKVIVGFGEVKVLVPCGDGQVLVKELIERSVARFMKVTKRDDPENVKVHYLAAADYGGILDPDDILSDVVDDKELLTAAYTDLASEKANAGGTESPKLALAQTPIEAQTLPSDTAGNYGIAQQRADEPKSKPAALESVSASITVRAEVTRSPRRSTPTHSRTGSSGSLQKSAVTVTREQLDESARRAAPLTVRRDSETNLLDDDSKQKQRVSMTSSSSIATLKPPPPPVAPKSQHAHSVSQPVAMPENFERALSGRQSLGTTASMRWLLAQQQAEEREAEAQEQALALENARKESEYATNREPETHTHHIRIENNGRQLGIQVVPLYDDKRQVELGFEVDSVIEGKRVHTEKLLNVGDRIVSINGRSLSGLHYQIAQDIFCKALRLPILELDIVRASDVPVPVPAQSPPPPPQASADNSGVQPSKTNERELAIQRANVKTIGSLHRVELTKSSESLGFSLTTRDTAVSRETLIYVKHIVAGGIAHRDGHLRVGDRLLEVNSVDVSDHSQADVVALLRAAPLGSVVHLLVSRQNDAAQPPPPPASNAPDVPVPPTPAPAVDADPPITIPTSATSIPTAEVLKLDVSLAFDSDNAAARERHAAVGLGVSVMGRTLRFEESGSAPRDLGIFIKSLVNGGAAQRDGRLRIDDRLIEVNGVTLLNLSNTDAMAALKRAIAENAQRTVCSLIVIRTSKADPEGGQLAPVGTSATPSGSVDGLQSADDPFARDAVGRVSISEKRHRKRDTVPFAKPESEYRSAPLPDTKPPPPDSAAPTLAAPSIGVNGYAAVNAIGGTGHSSDLMQLQRAASFDSLQRAMEGTDSVPSDTSSTRVTPVAVGGAQPAHNQDSVAIAPLELDRDMAIQLAKTRGSTESFRLAVDRSHPDGNSKSRRKGEKTRKADKDKDKTPSQPAEQNGGLFSLWKKKKQTDTGNHAPEVITITPRTDERPIDVTPVVNSSSAPVPSMVSVSASHAPNTAANATFSAPRPVAPSLAVSAAAPPPAPTFTASGDDALVNFSMQQKTVVRSKEERLMQIQREYQKQHRDERTGAEVIGVPPVRGQLPASAPLQQPMQASAPRSDARPKVPVSVGLPVATQPSTARPNLQLSASYVTPTSVAPSSLRPLPAGVGTAPSNPRPPNPASSYRAPASAPYRPPTQVQPLAPSPNPFPTNPNLQLSSRPAAPPKYEQAQAYVSVSSRPPVAVNVQMGMPPHRAALPLQQAKPQSANYRPLPGTTPNGFQQPPPRPVQPTAYSNPQVYASGAPITNHYNYNYSYNYN